MENTKLIEVIKAAVPQGAVPLFISVIGSRAKGLDGEKSDYDVRVIVLYPIEVYMLQRAPATCRIKTDLDGVEVEGSCVCLQQALRWALDTNPAIYDALYSVVLYETEVISKLRKLFELNYKPQKLRMALAGQIKTYTRVKKMGENRPTAVLKMATEAIYLSLKLRWVCLFKDEIPPMDIGLLINKVCADESGTKEWIFDIVTSRKRDKDGEYTKTEDYIKYISDSEALSETYKSEKKSESKNEVSKVIKGMQKKADDMFIEAIGFKSAE